ncbi:MAG TPA: hypothetical protein VD737_00015, partial [Steroidobacteraceae bacterium]|nr:hypothetical protein [Steroidobacteraceae bacterium]
MRRASFVLTMLGLVIAASATAAPVELLREVRHEAARRIVSGQLAATALDAASLALTLPDGRRVVARRTHLDRTSRSTTWTGEVIDMPGSRVALTSHRATVTGVTDIDGQTYELRPDAADGRHLLVEVDTS